MPRSAKTLALALSTIAALGLSACASKPLANEAAAASTEPTSTADASAAPAAPTSDAAAPAPEAVSCNQALLQGRYRWVRMARNTLEGMSCNTALWLDSVLGDAPDQRAAAKTSGRLDTTVTYSEFSGTDARVRLNVRIPLPNLERRLSAFIGREEESSFIQDRPEAQNLNDQFAGFQGNDQFLAGLGYSLPGSERFQSSLRVGVRNLRSPRVFAQYRLYYSPYADDVNLVYLRGTPFWNSDDGFGVTSGIEYNRYLGPTRLYRASTSGTISEKTEGLNWVVSSMLYQDLQRGRGIAPELFIRGETDEPEPLREYGVRVTYRQPILENNLFARLAPGYSWPRENPNLKREGSANILLGLELPFGRTQNSGPDADPAAQRK